MSGFTRRILISATTSLIAVRPASAQEARPALVTYKTFAGPSIEVRPFVGRNIALLLNPERSTDRVVTDRMLSAIDRGWEWYRDYFGRAPISNRTHAGKATITENAQDPAASARGIIGQTGIEVGPSSMNRLLLEAVQDRYNQAVFYELGRNFWFFNDQLGAMAPTANGGVFTTGFAHVHRFYSMEAANLVGAPWDDKLDFDGLRHSILVEMLDRYLASNALTWESTLAANKAPPNPYGWTADHLAAAFFHRIRRDHGHAGYRRFWQLMAKAPKANTPRDSAARFVQVARAATGEDYRGLLRDASLPLT
jgi:serralysin